MQNKRRDEAFGAAGYIVVDYSDPNVNYVQKRVSYVHYNIFL
jgi:hypothetical protein